jgi:hypothetical protein
MPVIIGVPLHFGFKLKTSLYYVYARLCRANGIDLPESLRSGIYHQPLTAPIVRPEIKYFWKNG